MKEEEAFKKLKKVEDMIGYTFKDPLLLATAFVHRSYVNETNSAIQSNERLEFLGDTVLGVLAAEHLYRNYPDIPEGELSFLRSRLVEANSCCNYIKKFNLEKFLLLSRGERISHTRSQNSILADLFEALIGAIFIDGGMEAAKHFFFTNFSDEINAILDTPLKNWKSLLQDFCQKHFQQTPVYEVLSQIGPDHSKVFTVVVAINDSELGRGQGNSKKTAQQAAAHDAMARLGPIP